MTRSCLLAVALIFGTALAGFAWGNDVLIYDGQVTCFDAAENPYDGTLYVAFQSTEHFKVFIYESEDGGMTWAPRWQINNVPRLPRLLVEYSEGSVHLFFVYDERMSTVILPVSGSETHTAMLRDVGVYFIDEEEKGADPVGFDVAHLFEEPHVWVLANYHHRTDGAVVSYSLDGGKSWEILFGEHHPEEANVDLSVARSPSTVYLVSISGGDTPEENEIRLTLLNTHGGWTDWGSSDRADVRLTDNGYRDFDPHIAVSSDPSFPSVWVSAAYAPHGDAHLDMVSSVSGRFDDREVRTIANHPMVSEYWGEMRAWPLAGNRWMNLLWIEDTGSFVRIRRAWASGDDPGTWHFDDSTINSHNAMGWPISLAPRLVYSPRYPDQHLSLPGPGIVYAGFGRYIAGSTYSVGPQPGQTGDVAQAGTGADYYFGNGLYFDAFWIEPPPAGGSGPAGP